MLKSLLQHKEQKHQAQSNQKNTHKRGYMEMSVYHIIIPNYKEKINRHLWLCKGPMKRLIGKKLLPGIENSRKASVKVLNSFKLQGNNKERKNAG